MRGDVQQTEAQFAAAVIEYAELCGWLVKRDPMYRATAASPGFPDLVLARGGVVRFMELKSEKGRLTEAQWDWAHAIGEQWYVMRPSDWPEIEKVLR